jgi:hypothetical protein
MAGWDLETGDESVSLSVSLIAIVIAIVTAIATVIVNDVPHLRVVGKYRRSLDLHHNMVVKSAEEVVVINDRSNRDRPDVFGGEVGRQVSAKDCLRSCLIGGNVSNASIRDV